MSGFSIIKRKNIGQVNCAMTSKCIGSAMARTSNAEAGVKTSVIPSTC